MRHRTGRPKKENMGSAATTIGIGVLLRRLAVGAVIAAPFAAGMMSDLLFPAPAPVTIRPSPPAAVTVRVEPLPSHLPPDARAQLGQP